LTPTDPIRSATFVKGILDVFSAQLDVIALNDSLASDLSTDLWTRIKPKTLVNAFGELQELSTRASYIQIRTGSPAGAIFFENLTRNIDGLPATRSLTHLYLPLHLSVKHTGQQLHQASMQTFLDKCAAKKIEVVFEEALDDWCVFQQVPQDFRRKIKTKKLEE
jgi:hypothetical protein